MADLYIHNVIDARLSSTILETKSTHHSRLTLTDNHGHETIINIFFDSDTNYNWESITKEWDRGSK